MITNRDKVLMSCGRPPNHILRKQKSLNCESVCQLASNTRERRFRLQKQFSIDQNSNIRDVALNRSINVNCQPKCGNSINNNNNHTTWNGHDQVPETSLRIFTAFKNKTNTNGTESKDECVKYIFFP